MSHVLAAPSAHGAVPAARHGTEPRTGTPKVPHLVGMFWVVKIAATTLGETGGDAVSMSGRLGYAMASIVFLTILAVLVTREIMATRYRPAL